MQYVQQLKEELVQAEAALAEEQKLHEQQQHIENSKLGEQNKEPIAETKTNKPGDEWNAHLCYLLVQVLEKPAVNATDSINIARVPHTSYC